MLSIICAYNNKGILEECLISSLDNQLNKDYELILIDTLTHKFISAAEALNFGAEQAKGDNLLFIHQDVVLDNNNFIEDLSEWINKYEFGIAGLAGAITKNKQNLTITNSFHGIPRKLAGEISNLMEATQCETVDEFAFVIPKNIFDENPFITFYPSWHLYAVEYCLRMRSIGHRVCVFPLSVWHRSEGDSFDPSYFKTIKPIARKYRYEFKKISTTMGGWATNNLGLNLHIARYRFSLWRKQSKQQLKCLFKLVI